MKTFEIEIKETLSKVIEVKSNSLEEALVKAKESYDSEKIILDYSDHINTEIDIANLSDIENDTDFGNFVLKNAEKMIVNLSQEELVRLAFGSLLNAKEEYEKLFQ